MPERDRQIEKERGREEGRKSEFGFLMPLLASKHSQTDHVQRVHFTLRLCKTRPGDDTGMADCDPKRSRGITWYCIIQYDLIRRCKFQKILSLLSSSFSFDDTPGSLVSPTRASNVHFQSNPIPTPGFFPSFSVLENTVFLLSLSLFLFF